MDSPNRCPAERLSVWNWFRPLFGLARSPNHSDLEGLGDRVMPNIGRNQSKTESLNLSCGPWKQSEAFENDVRNGLRG